MSENTNNMSDLNYECGNESKESEASETASPLTQDSNAEALQSQVKALEEQLKEKEQKYASPKNNNLNIVCGDRTICRCITF